MCRRCDSLRNNVENYRYTYKSIKIDVGLWFESPQHVSHLLCQHLSQVNNQINVEFLNWWYH